MITTGNITTLLQKLDPTLTQQNEGRWGQPYEIGPGFSSFNDAGVECETGEFLYSMVRMLKPLRVLETGTHWGVGASYIGMALKDNQQGELDTLEFIPEIHQRACKRLDTLKLRGQWVVPILMRVENYHPPYNFQLILLDTEPQTRFAELIKFYDYLDEGGFIFIHDLHRHMHQIPNEEHGFAWPYGQLPYQIRQLVREDKLRPFHFSTPRGLTGFYKVSKEDYKW